MFGPDFIMKLIKLYIKHHIYIDKYIYIYICIRGGIMRQRSGHEKKRRGEKRTDQLTGKRSQKH